MLWYNKDILTQRKLNMLETIVTITVAVSITVSFASLGAHIIYFNILGK